MKSLPWRTGDQGSNTAKHFGLHNSVSGTKWKRWETDLQQMVCKKEMHDYRIGIEDVGDLEFSLVIRPAADQIHFVHYRLFTMNRGTRLGSRIADVHNGVSPFTGSARQGHRNIRR